MVNKALRLPNYPILVCHRGAESVSSPKSRILSTTANPYVRVQSRSRSNDGDEVKSREALVADNRPIEEKYTHRDIINIALVMSPLWFLANCLYNYSLLMTSVGSSTIIR